MRLLTYQEIFRNQLQQNEYGFCQKFSMSLIDGCLTIQVNTSRLRICSSEQQLRKSANLFTAGELESLNDRIAQDMSILGKLSPLYFKQFLKDRFALNGFSGHNWFKEGRIPCKLLYSGSGKATGDCSKAY